MPVEGTFRLGLPAPREIAIALSVGTVSGFALTLIRLEARHYVIGAAAGEGTLVSVSLPATGSAIAFSVILMIALVVRTALRSRGYLVAPCFTIIALAANVSTVMNAPSATRVALATDFLTIALGLGCAVYVAGRYVDVSRRS